MEERSLSAVENDVIHQFHSIKMLANLIELYTKCDLDAYAGKRQMAFDDINAIFSTISDNLS